MGILQRLGLTRADRPAGTSSTSLAIRSPFTEGQLSQVVWADVTGVETSIVTRAAAMRVPSVAKARHILASTIAAMPLRAMRLDEVLPVQPTWLYRTDGVVSPWQRMAWTVDDLMFNDWCLWAVARDATGRIAAAERIPPEWWHFNHDGGVSVTNPLSNTSYTPTEDEVVLIPGPGVCLLENASTTIRAALDLERAWAGRIKNPIPAMEIHQTTDDQLTEQEIADLIKGYAKSRQDPLGAIAFTPHNVEFKPHGVGAIDMFENARNAVRLDVANFTGLPGAALDGALATASLTYVTQDGKRTELADAVDLWTAPIEQRLSQDDCSPRGHRVRFDKTNSFLPTPTGIEIED